MLPGDAIHVWRLDEFLLGCAIHFDSDFKGPAEGCSTGIV